LKKKIRIKKKKEREGENKTKKTERKADLEKDDEEDKSTSDIVLAYEKDNHKILKEMNEIRTNVDVLKKIVANKYWSITKYSKNL